jgi:outer membrane biosynthesis protein TonB
LAGSLDRIRITTSNGTDTFDAGSVNIMYEG